jgi:hypothetical protein
LIFPGFTSNKVKTDQRVEIGSSGVFARMRLMPIDAVVAQIVSRIFVIEARDKKIPLLSQVLAWAAEYGIRCLEFQVAHFTFESVSFSHGILGYNTRRS